MATKQTVTVDTHNRMSMKELEDILLTNCKLIMDDPNMASAIPPILIHSSPGVGKSSIVRQVARKLGIGFVDVRLAEMESVDIRGLPSVDKENGVMKWNAPDFWPRDPKSKGIIFLDELIIFHYKALEFRFTTLIIKLRHKRIIRLCKNFTILEHAP